MLRSSGSRWRARTNTRQGWIKPGESSPRALGTSGPVLPPCAGLPGLGTTVIQQLPFYYWGAMPSRETHTALHTSTDSVHHTALCTSTEPCIALLCTSTDTMHHTTLYPQELTAVQVCKITRTSMARQPGQASFPRRKGTREVTVPSSA